MGHLYTVLYELFFFSFIFFPPFFPFNQLYEHKLQFLHGMLYQDLCCTIKNTCLCKVCKKMKNPFLVIAENNLIASNSGEQTFALAQSNERSKRSAERWIRKYNDSIRVGSTLNSERLQTRVYLSRSTMTLRNVSTNQLPHQRSAICSAMKRCSN